MSEKSQKTKKTQISQIAIRIREGKEYSMKKVNILGNDYLITKNTYEEEPCLKENHWNGYCDMYAKRIVLLDLDKVDAWKNETRKTKDECMNSSLRHEIVHAFLSESGLDTNAGVYDKGWARNEEMVDWIALQFPKMHKVYAELGIL